MPESMRTDLDRAISTDPVPGVTVRVGLGLIPAWILLIAAVWSPTTIEPLGDNPPSIAGLPLGILIIAAALLLMTVGLLGLRGTSSATSMVVWLSISTAPSAALILVTPVLIRLLELSSLA